MHFLVPLLVAVPLAEGSPSEEPAASKAELFAPIASVLTHPRCINCHQDQSPRQTDAKIVHQPLVVRGKDGHGAPTQRCQTCHQATNTADGFVPGVTSWGLAPLSMLWEGKTQAYICQQIKDPQRNGGRRTAEEIVEHMKSDPLVLWAWNPGAGRTTPPLSHAQFVDALDAWVEAGMPCQKEQARTEPKALFEKRAAAMNEDVRIKEGAVPADPRSAENTNLFRLEDLEDVSRTGKLSPSDSDALRTVAAWIRSFVVRPHKDLGRAGPVCPFVPDSLERKTLWLAPEHVGGRSVRQVVDLVSAYQKVFLGAQPRGGDDAIYKSIFVVFTDLPADRAKEFFDSVLQDLAVPSYVNDGFVMGGFYEGNQATSIHNPSFRPFTSPVPALLMRQAVISDWKFFLDNEAWLKLWAQRYGAAGAETLASELRRLPWRTHPE